MDERDVRTLKCVRLSQLFYASYLW